MLAAFPEGESNIGGFFQNRRTGGLVWRGLHDVNMNLRATVTNKKKCAYQPLSNCASQMLLKNTFLLKSQPWALCRQLSVGPELPVVPAQRNNGGNKTNWWEWLYRAKVHLKFPWIWQNNGMPVSACCELVFTHNSITDHISACHQGPSKAVLVVLVSGSSLVGHTF